MPVQTRPRSAADDAAEIERKRCSPDLDLGELAPVLSGEAVEGFEPAHISAQSCGGGAGGCYKRLAGAVISVRPIKGYTAEWLDRALDCHSARRVLGRARKGARPDDPFWLPGRIVDIDVVSTGKGFAVSVRSLDVQDAQEILARARAFVAAAAQR